MDKDKILDPEWVELLLIALESGLTPDEIREFFESRDSS